MIDEDGIMSEFFGRISPEKAGVSSRKVSEYIKHLKRRGVVFHSLMLLKGNDIFCEAYVKPFDETEEVFMDRIRRSKEQGRNLFFEEWPLFVHEWETDPDVIL
jgi:hypothetical protein